MIVYGTSPVHDRTSGKYLREEIVPIGIACDFCGERIDEEGVIVAFQIKELGGSEESYYFHEFPGLRPSIVINGHKVFSEHTDFQYCTDMETGESVCNCRMIREADPEDNLEFVMQKARIKMLVTLLNSERYSPQDFKIEAD